MLEVVCGILEKDGKYLIAKRGKGIHENSWEFPGGKVEEQERKEEAVVREIKEELELDVESIRFLIDVYDERKEETIHVSAYLCKIIFGTLRLHVHYEARYVSAKELYNYQFEAADKAILDLLNKETKDFDDYVV